MCFLELGYEVPLDCSMEWEHCLRDDISFCDIYLAVLALDLKTTLRIIYFFG